MKNTILLASQNPGKIIEIRHILGKSNFNIISPKDLSLDLNIKETGHTYAANARLKAKAYLEATGLMTLADDSGLEVDALSGAPGIYSARFSSKENATDRDRRHYLLEQLQPFPQPWHAHFHCTVIVAIPGGTYIETNGQVQGQIISDERGSGGFGYDPIFFIPEMDKTMAELESHIKNIISHRAKALTALLPFLEIIEDFSQP